MEEELQGYQKVEKISEYSIFNPKSARVLYEDYPELREYKQFKGLAIHELLFVWFYACQASPLYPIMDKRKRCEEAMKKSYLTNPSRPKIDGRDKESFLAGKFTTRIQAAIEVMSKFRIGPRVRAKMVAEKTFNNYAKIVDVDASDDSKFLNKDGEVDYAKKKSFVDLSAKVIELLPTLIEQLEGTFGVGHKKETESLDEGFDGESFMDSFHEQKD
jgi:hypothetical protein